MSHELFGGVEVVDGQERQEFVLGRGTPFEIHLYWPQAALPLQHHFPECDRLLLGLRNTFAQKGAHAQVSIIDGIRGLFCLTAVDVEKLEARNAALEKRVAELEKAVLRVTPIGNAKPIRETSNLPMPEFVDATAEDEDPA